MKLVNQRERQLGLDNVFVFDTFFVTTLECILGSDQDNKLENIMKKVGLKVQGGDLRNYKLVVFPVKD
jgi:hypothetical protein